MASSTPAYTYHLYDENDGGASSNVTDPVAPNPLLTALRSIQGIILTLALGGNVAAVVALLIFKRRRRKLSRMHLFILHLCVADIAVALFNVAPNLCFLVSLPGPCPVQSSTSSCKAVNYLSLVAIYGSTYVLVMTAVDRFIAIQFPFTAQRLADYHVHLMVFVAWLLSFVFSIPQAVIFNFHESSQMCYTQWHSEEARHAYYADIYMGWFACAVWIVPTAIIAVCYIGITLVVWNRRLPLLKSDASENNSRRVNSKLQPSSSGQPSSRLRLMKPVRLTLAVIIGYVLCWSPWMISMMSIQYRKSDAQPSRTVSMVTELLTYLIGFNSCLNPWIYLCFNCKTLRVSRSRRQETSCHTTYTTPDARNSGSTTVRLSRNLTSDRISNL